VHRECIRTCRQVGSANGRRVLGCGEIHLLEKTGHGLKKKIKRRERSQSTTRCRYGRPLVSDSPCMTDGIGPIRLRSLYSAWFQASAAKQMRTALYWDITQRVVVTPYPRFGTSLPRFWGLPCRLFGAHMSRNVGKELPPLA
jgi:hypothetical protein